MYRLKFLVITSSKFIIGKDFIAQDFIAQKFALNYWFFFFKLSYAPMTRAPSHTETYWLNSPKAKFRKSQRNFFDFLRFPVTRAPSLLSPMYNSWLLCYRLEHYTLRLDSHSPLVYGCFKRLRFSLLYCSTRWGSLHIFVLLTHLDGNVLFTNSVNSIALLNENSK